ncbi:MAG: hypothetical protein ACXWTW_07075 [Methylobacter sp.]
MTPIMGWCRQRSQQFSWPGVADIGQDIKAISGEEYTHLASLFVHYRVVKRVT